MSDRLRQAVAALEHARAGVREQSSPQEPDLFGQLESVADHAGDEWRDRALDLVHWLALTRDTFTVEDLDEQLRPRSTNGRSGGCCVVELGSAGTTRSATRTVVRRGTAALIVLWQSDVRGGDAA
jgi:hypothetical protein